MTSRSIILSLLLITAVVVMAVIGALRAYAPSTPHNAIACTEEALMCPDGSAVGRSGPECTFTACPNPGSFVGTMDQPVPGSYYLRMNSVLPEAKEPYIMPLDFSLSSDSTFKDFLNTTIHVQGKFFQGNTLMVTSFGSSITPTDITVVPDNIPKDTVQPGPVPNAADCMRQGGTFNETHEECTGIDENSCKNIAGTWNECGSACRHNPSAEMCTMQCVQYCQL